MIASAPCVPQTRPNGFIIVAVLWILAALATLVSIYAIYVRDTADQFTAHEDRLQSEALVSAAIELTAYQLTSTTAQSRPTHGGFNFRIGKANVSVTFQSEDARIDLNTASKELLAGLFVALDVDLERAANYADRIVLWRTPAKDQSSALVGQTSGTNNNAASAARFFHVDELSLVPGLPTAVAERALPFLTVYSGRPQVNIFEAAPEVLAALPGMSKERLDVILAKRQVLTDGQALSQLLGPAQNYVTTEGSSTSRVTIQVAYDNGHKASSEVIILPFDNGPDPYAILSWQDELEPPAKEGLRMVSR
jgi:general secretion pathway protein K